ncbi:UvrD-helicase domain-containing protein [Nocardioides panacisoli]|uniref:UvrD-helicase domain-containing protein n=1 Tax=Nocardioides panacisoli TaxID=627624 RepID=UPI001F011777|nr:UvrD-helicase domain-containing protein [Nocardioides panacisoli]
MEDPVTTSTPTPQPFDLAGPLPEGTTLLEASAGTGKTFTLGALVTRYVAEGHARLEEMLVITFGRAATQEMRERVRSAMVGAERALADPATADPDNTLLTHLLDADEAERARRRRRLRDALASFDGATIATIHQFCQLVLRSLGVAGDSDTTADLVESLDDLVVEVVDDLYLQTYGDHRGTPPFDRAAALALARKVVDDAQADLAEPDEGNTAAEARVGFARAVRTEVERRKRRRGVLSFNDLLSRLATALEQADGPARARMRARWRIVLVDEFQDTDPVQWQVLDRAFTGHAAMVLIGDPKQAIYAFRGGDVETYLRAAATTTTHATLGTNWRTDADLLDRLQVVLRGAGLGHTEIVVRDVAARHAGTRLAGAPYPAPFRVRQVRRDGFRLSRYGEIFAGDARSFIADDCAADIAGLLGSGATWDGREVRAGDIAVIVAERAHGHLVQRALARLGVNAVLPGGDLFATPAADEWHALLTALAAPHRSGLVRAAALTHFFGLTAEQLDAEGEDVTARVADVLRGWAVLLRGRGVAALVEAAEERGLGARALGEVDGERFLTDARHLGHLLHDVAVRGDLGLTALLDWFHDERTRTAHRGERPRRLDSDAAAVQIVTIHGSKGLEYPICYVPFAYQYNVREPDAALFHGEHGRTLDVSGSGRGWRASVARHRSEDLGEELRDLYVALTRAQSQVVTWWAPTAITSTGPLHRVLFGRQPGTAEVPDEQDLVDDDRVGEILGLIEQLGGPAAEVARVAAPAPLAAEESRRDVTVREFTRDIDHGWRRTSYSGLIRVEEAAPGPVDLTAPDGAMVASEPETTGRDDEEVVDEPPQAVVPSPGSDEVPVSPMADLPAGATFGSLVHAVLEHADPDAEDLRAELLTHVHEQLRWWSVDAAPGDLADALVPLHHTSLGPLTGGLTLAGIPLRDRLCELDFEFPLAGGDLGDRDAARRAEPRLRDLAPLLRRHLPDGDPIAAYADRLEQPVLGDQPLRGYLSGSVDVVLRLPSGRFVVVDYKTNRLESAEDDAPATAADYAPDRLAEAMLHSHYPLQAMLYSVVLHRYLRWRLPGYDPATHLGGVLYLYVRGMCGPDTPETDGHPAGVFSWHPPAEFVVALSDLLAGGGA